MHEPDPEKVMACLSARQFSEWMAYEKAFGPIDRNYDQEMLAQLHELLQVNNQLTGAAITKKGKKNPAGKFRRVPRAHEMFDPHFDEDDFDEEEEEENEFGERPSDIAKFDAEVFGSGAYEVAPPTLDDAVIEENAD
jgi:hypothetical protein